ncbi:response regulator [Frigoriglobus tundricola]|nr:response regulator [Frigoriglobus tundricola]
MPHPRQLRLLVVDDHPDSADSLSQLLSLLGHDARAARTCAEARTALDQGAGFAPDVVVLDVRLPDGDGFALAAELRRRLERPPVFIALTGLQDQEQKCHAAGFDHYLLKPVEPARLAALLAALCRPE